MNGYVFDQETALYRSEPMGRGANKLARVQRIGKRSGTRSNRPLPAAGERLREIQWLPLRQA